MHKRLLALVISLAITSAQSAQAATSISYEPSSSLVTSSGSLLGSGHGRLGKSIRGLLPSGWDAVYTDAYIAGLNIDWSSSANWTDPLATFATKNSLSILVDGGKKTVIFARANDVLNKGVKTVSSLSPAFEDMYQLSNVYQTALRSDNSAVINEAMKVDAAALPKEGLSIDQELSGISESSSINVPVKPLPSPVKPVIAKPDKKVTTKDGVTITEETFSVQEPSNSGLTVTTDSSTVPALSSVASNKSTSKSIFSVKPLSSFLPEPEASYLQVVGAGDERLKIEDGQLAFKVEPGSLQDNLEKLASYTRHTNIVYNVSKNHRLPNEFWVYGDGVLSIIDQLVDPFVSPRPVKANWYENNIVEITYEGSAK